MAGQRERRAEIGGQPGQLTQRLLLCSVTVTAAGGCCGCGCAAGTIQYTATRGA
jgi:hypothetical protein